MQNTELFWGPSDPCVWPTLSKASMVKSVYDAVTNLRSHYEQPESSRIDFLRGLSQCICQTKKHAVVYRQRRAYKGIHDSISLTVIRTITLHATQVNKAGL